VSRIELRGIVKRFGSVQALRGADFVVVPGRVHALLGENGAGKSTLMHVAYGMVAADAGEIHVDGVLVAIRSPRDARALGIGMVHQHFTSVPALSVRENVLLAGGRLEAHRGNGVLGQLWRGLDPDALVESLSVAEKQRLEIVKALAAGARVLLLDEPTAVLAPAEVDELLAAIRLFAAHGGAVVLITHKLDEVLAVAEEVTVLRHGRVTLQGPIEGQSEASLAEAMIGQAVMPASPASVNAPPPAGARVVVELDEASVAPLEGRGPGLRQASLALRAGELVGVAAVEGNGHRELLLALAGLLPLTAGTRRVEEPVVLVPEDRTTEGLIPGFTLTENMVLGLEGSWRRGPWVDWGSARQRTAALLPEFDVRAPSADALAGMLSGGNQQKLILARALEASPGVLVVENPTRGLDVLASAAVHRRIREAAARGVAVLVYSSDLDEVLDLSQRLLVVARGQVTGMPATAGRDEVGAAMLGVTAERP
jgi:ABC-type uncharacterized transport system ATPase subunit